MVAASTYSIGDELGRGGMGRVLSADDHRLRRRVAIKELIATTTDARGRFEREALITARLQHPAIVPIYEAGCWPSGEPFYTMKLVAGRSLDKAIEEAITMRDRIALVPKVIAMAEALAYAHEHRVIHRDLKPQNVLVGGFGETVVLDWGLAKDLDAADPATSGADVPTSTATATIAGSVMGTPAYMSPEQARGEQVDERTDVYSLGAVLYHVLARRPPYDGGDSMAILRALRVAAPKPLAELEREVPPELAAIVAKSMARDAAERYPTARELVEDLRRFETGQLVGVHRYSLGALLRRWARRHRGALAVAAAAFVAVVTITIIAITRIIAANEIAERERDEARAQREVAIDAKHAAEDSRREIADQSDRHRFVRERAVEMNHYAHTQLMVAGRRIECRSCHSPEPTTMKLRTGIQFAHADCDGAGCHDATKMAAKIPDRSCAQCHRARPVVAIAGDRPSRVQSCEKTKQPASGPRIPCFKHELAEHHGGDCDTCHGIVVDRARWQNKDYTSLDDLKRNPVTANVSAEKAHAACAGCHERQLALATSNCGYCHPNRPAMADW